MSIDRTIIVQVKCDRCGILHSLTGDGARDAKKFAKEAGWKIGKSKDFCKECSAEISKVIKAAASGNL